MLRFTTKPCSYPQNHILPNKLLHSNWFWPSEFRPMNLSPTNLSSMNLIGPKKFKAPKNILAHKYSTSINIQHPWSKTNSYPTNIWHVPPFWPNNMTNNTQPTKNKPNAIPKSHQQCPYSCPNQPNPLSNSSHVLGNWHYVPDLAAWKVGSWEVGPWKLTPQEPTPQESTPQESTPQDPTPQQLTN